MIRAPYNFVPLSNKIFFPDWVDKISHDVPFSDGVSGEIEIKLRAETPIFIRNGSKNNDETEFSHYIDENGNKQYFIPGTSIKGMIRNVFEIISFSKMQIVDDRKFTWRDLSNKDYTNNFTKGINEIPMVNSGFIKIENDSWVLYPCKYARIEQFELDSLFGVSKDILSASEKYKFWTETKRKSLSQKFDITGPSTTVFKKQCGTHYRAIINSTGKITGSLVFTGQIGPRNEGEEGKHGKGKKHLEFMFFDESKKSINIDQKMRRDFELNHSDERNKANHKRALSPNAEWGFWKDKLKNGDSMPVFWLGKKNEVESFGLSMLYRLPLKYSVQDKIKIYNPDYANKEKCDLTEAVFGRHFKNNSLKGRIQFINGVCNTKNPKILDKVNLSLASPKPTFYPNYLKNGNYSNYGSSISGRKRYPVHKQYNSQNEIESKVTSSFLPLDKGNEFTGKIRFHNLKEIELGALLIAITFFEKQECFHSIGMAKAFGYGRIKIDVTNVKSSLKIQKSNMELMKKFIDYLFDNNQINWYNEAPIRELFAMARIQNNRVNTQTELTYLEFDHDKRIDQFKDSRLNHESLPYYSKLSNKICKVTLLLDEERVKLDKKIEKIDILQKLSEKIDIDSHFEFWQQSNNWNSDKEIAKAFETKIEKYKSDGSFTNQYKKIAEILNIDLDKIKEEKEKSAEKQKKSQLINRAKKLKKSADFRAYLSLLKSSVNKLSEEEFSEIIGSFSNQLKKAKRKKDIKANAEKNLLNELKQLKKG